MALQVPRQRPVVPALPPVQPVENNNLARRGQKFKLAKYKLGFSEILLGCFVVVLEIVACASIQPSPSYKTLSFSAAGVWCGVFLITSGILGVEAKSHLNAGCLGKANLAMSVIAWCFMLILVVVSAIQAKFSNSGAAPLHFIMSAIGGVGLIIIAIPFVYHCVGICDQRPQPSQGTVLYMMQQESLQLSEQTIQPNMQQVMMQLADGQLLLLQGQPIPVPGYPVSTMQPLGEPPPYEPSTNPLQQQTLLPPASNNQPTQLTNDGF